MQSGTQRLTNRSPGLLALDTKPSVFDVVSFELNRVPDRKASFDLAMDECNDTGLLLWVFGKGLRNLGNQRRQFLVAKGLRLQPDGVFLRQLDGLEDTQDVFELFALARGPQKSAEILLRLLAGDIGFPLPSRTEVDDIIGRDFMREVFRAVG